MQSQDGSGNGWGSYYRSVTGLAGSTQEGREGGGRRKRLTEFLKSANELRQSYTAGYSARTTELEKAKEYVDGSGEQSNTPDVDVIRSGDEQLVLFPSYARERPKPDLKQSFQMTQGNEEDSWVDDAPVDDGNVVDVDVRGWLFTPHSGPLSRKNRYLIWAARQLCGLPAQPPQTGESIPVEPEDPKLGDSTETKAAPRSAIPNSEQLTGLHRTVSAPTAAGAFPSPNPLTETAQDSTAAHNALMSRLAPFMHRSIASAPITIFYFNSTTSQSRTIRTSDNGHFSARVALPFVPTHVRVLASETLSATEEIVTHRVEGVSLISDIDDTVKHSSVSLGAREMFRNTFTAPLSSLTIPGVAGWYRRLAGEPYKVDFHYISNSPWQLYPLLISFFQEVGLPPGSMHLKQYSGMLQGIFEPVAERKKGTVERVIQDFPHRKWVLVGDSGEADLEIYTGVVEKFPGRILAVFIRDVTTTDDGRAFFDDNGSGRDTIDAVAGMTNDEKRPPLPRRRTMTTSDVPEGDLIGLSEPNSGFPATNANRNPPPRPPKPLELRALPKTLPAPPPSPPTSRPPSLASSLSSSPSRASWLRNPPPAPSPLRRNSTTFDGQTSSLPSTEPLLTKKEELWRRRWERAEFICESYGVSLKSWRVGGDVEAACRSAVETGLWGK